MTMRDKYPDFDSSDAYIVDDNILKILGITLEQLEKILKDDFKEGVDYVGHLDPGSIPPQKYLKKNTNILPLINFLDNRRKTSPIC